MGRLPELVGCRGPAVGIARALVAQVIDALRILIIRVHRTGFLDHPAQAFRVFQHRAGAQHVVVARLIVKVGHEQRALERFKQRVLMDIHIGIVDEYARLDVALGIDVQIAAASGNAAVNILRVVLEIDGELFLLKKEELIEHSYFLAICSKK